MALCKNSKAYQAASPSNIPDSSPSVVQNDSQVELMNNNTEEMEEKEPPLTILKDCNND